MADESELTVSQKIGKLIHGSRVVGGKKKPTAERLESLKKAERLIFETDDSSLLDNFLDEMLEFLNAEEDQEIRAFTMLFVTSAIERDPEVVNKVVNTFTEILQPAAKQSAFIRKQVVRVCTRVYSTVLAWVNHRRHDLNAGTCWKAFAILKNDILGLFGSKNEGLRMMAIKFMEVVIICQTHRQEANQTPKGADELISLKEIHRDHRVLSYQQLEREAQHNFASLIDQLSSSDIASQTLLTVVQVVCNIARQRPVYMLQVVSALESLHVNLPPTLATNQVKSLRKELRYELLRMLQHPSARNMPTAAQVNAALQQRAAQMMATSAASTSTARPQPSGTVRSGDHLGEEVGAKRIRLDDDEYLDEGTVEILRGASGNVNIGDASQRAIDITTDFVYERLSLNVVVKLVTISLFTLPDEMPAAFQSSYTKIPNAGTDEQKRHLSRIMAIQLTKEGEGPGVKYIREEKQKQYFARQNARHEGAAIAPTPLHEARDLSQRTEQPHEKVVEKFKAPQQPKRKRIQEWDLLKITKELNVSESEKLAIMAFKRMTENEQYAIQGGAIVAQHQLLRNRVDLAVMWLKELFVQYQGKSSFLTTNGPLDEQVRLSRYDKVLCGMLGLLVNRNDIKENLFHQILLEAPLVTSDALGWLRKACFDPTFGGLSMSTLRDLILKRPTQRAELLELFLSFGYVDPAGDSQNERTAAHDLREICVSMAKELYAEEHIRDDLRAFVIRMSEQLTLPTAPLALVAHVRHLSDEQKKELADLGDPILWDEQLIRCALYVFMALLPVDHSLLTQLARITANAKTTEVKRVIFRTVEKAVKAIGMKSPHLLDMIEECPPGAEPLVARVVHLLTERNAPTAELVEKVRNLHKSRNTDVRSLLPILTGLPRDELRQLIPKFVMNATNSKSVPLFFRKLMLSRHTGTNQVLMPPAELLVEFHLLETENAREHSHLVQNIDQLIVDPDHVYHLPKEFIAKAIEELLARNPLPKLVYHTLQKVHDSVPALKGFLLNVLHKTTHGQHADDEKLKEIHAKFAGKPNKENAISTILSY
ncbi:Symplekin [Aphelenchoides fujianensis]|nr:Symplekin [Aphelenchoides fujianensis]